MLTGSGIGGNVNVGGGWFFRGAIQVQAAGGKEARSARVPSLTPKGTPRGSPTGSPTGSPPASHPPVE